MKMKKAIEKSSTLHLVINWSRQIIIHFIQKKFLKFGEKIPIYLKLNKNCQIWFSVQS